MHGLKLLLNAKIIGTLIFWCLPLLCLSGEQFVQLGFPSPEPLLFVRLLGAAYFSLLVGYYFGIKALNTGASTLPTIVTGIISNATAFCILIFFGITGGWSAWGMGAQIFMWISTGGALFIAASLLYFYSRISR